MSHTPAPACPACARASSPRSFLLCSWGVSVSQHIRERGLCERGLHEPGTSSHQAPHCCWPHGGAALGARPTSQHLPKASPSAPGPQGLPWGPAAQGDSLISLWLWRRQALGLMFPIQTHVVYAERLGFVHVLVGDGD